MQDLAYSQNAKVSADAKACAEDHGDLAVGVLVDSGFSFLSCSTL